MAYKPYPISTSDTNYQTTIADLKRMENSKISNKIIFGTDSTLKVTAKSTPNMSVDVSSGLCISAGLYNYSSTSVNIPIESNTASYPRIDAIVVYLNGISSCIKVLKGTAAATPSSPVCTSNTYIKLAEVYVGAGVSSIQSSNITDCRAKDGQHIIESLSDLIFTMESNLNSLITKVNAPSQVTTLGSYPYSPTTLDATPNRIYRIDGYNNAEVKHLASKVISFCSHTLPPADILPFHFPYEAAKLYCHCLPESQATPRSSNPEGMSLPAPLLEFPGQ